MKKFNKKFSGYSKNEVNNFVNDVITQTEKLLKKVEYQQDEINHLKAQIIHYKEIEKSLKLALNSSE